MQSYVYRDNIAVQLYNHPLVCEIRWKEPYYVLPLSFIFNDKLFDMTYYVVYQQRNQGQLIIFKNYSKWMFLPGYHAKSVPSVRHHPEGDKREIAHHNTRSQIFLSSYFVLNHLQKTYLIELWACSEKSKIKKARTEILKKWSVPFKGLLSQAPF